MPALSTSKIWQIASFDRRIRSKVALELICSWPAPAMRDRVFGAWFFYYTAFGPPPAKEFNLYPPSWVAWLRFSDGSVQDLRRVSPRDVGLLAKEGEPFATFSWPKNLSYDLAEKKRAELFDSYDAVLPRFWEASGNKPTSSGKLRIQDFQGLFLELTPSPLLPCYRTLAPEFFKWTQL